MAKESETSSRKIQLNKMNTNIQIFTSDIFGEIRTCQVNNQIMFVGKDVAQALGYSNTRDALSKHVDAEDKLESQIATSGQRRAIILINESGLYSLILSSQLPQAKAFKRWVTSEVHVDAEDKLESQIATSGQRRAIILINN
jgi:prophage antirepressor-like protein